MAIEYKVIGRHIRTARRNKGLTQEELAEMLSMSPAHFGKVERGERAINLQRLGELSAILGISLESLISGAEVSDSREHGSETEIREQTDFVAAVEQLSKGCSEKALRLMLRVCADIADEDKSSST